jgi:NADP-dependent 3-hydroxy acid dehydrogenase YdfG
MKQQSMGLAVITGASSGIGAVYADRLARRGYDLLLVVRNQERMTNLANRLASETGSGVDIMAASLTDPKDLANLERFLRDESGVSLLVNNAGAGATAPLLKSDVADMSRLITLNVEALMRLTYAVVPGFVKRGSGEGHAFFGRRGSHRGRSRIGCQKERAVFNRGYAGRHRDCAPTVHKPGTQPVYACGIHPRHRRSIDDSF